MSNKNQTKVAVLEKFSWVNFKTKALAETGIVMFLTLLAPVLLAHTAGNQWIVGPVVNAGLFWLAIRAGVGNAFLVAFLPSLIALSRGMLPPQTIALIPFIILGNLALILVANAFREKIKRGIFFASFAKAMLIVLPALLILPKASLALVFAWPQLLTAFLGGAIFWLVAKKF